ncbi:MAG: hypothetical protein L6406_21060 [Desulfobacterales bacterium]|nr:hypothetical protein [Desulfobacterales bacterium]
MPIEIIDCDDGIGNIIVTRGMVTDQELIDSLERHLTHDKEKFKKYKYILIDHTALTKVDITNETVEFIAGLYADTSRVNPDSIVAMVTYVTYGASIDLINRISRMHELFVYRSCWETLVFRTKGEAVRWIREKARDKFGIDDLTFS